MNDLFAHHFLNVIAYVGFVIAVVGLLVSVWQLRQNFKQAVAFTDMVERVGRVREALSTQVMGEWPDYLFELAEFIGRTERYLKIVRDVPSYGIFSNLEGHHAYQMALEDSLVHGNDLSIIFMGSAARRRLNVHFASPAARSWAPEFTDKMHAWLDRLRVRDPRVPTPDGFDDYLDMLEYTNQMVLTRLVNAAWTGSERTGRKLFTQRETDAMVPLYIWVRDGVEAIFAVAVFSPEEEKEIAFITSDLGLVKALEAAFDRYSEEAGSCGPDLAPPSPFAGPFAHDGQPEPNGQPDQDPQPAG